MNRRVALAWLTASLIVAAPTSREIGTHAPPQPTAARPADRSVGASLPVRFEENRGQWDPHVRFFASGAGVGVTLTDDGMTLGVRDPQHDVSASVELRLVGGSRTRPVGEHALTTRSNYFIGNDPAKWRTGVPSYERVVARGVVSGVDIAWREGGGGVEYDVLVAPGTDAASLAFDIERARAISLLPDGSLAIETAAGTIVERAPRVMQEGKELAARYRIEGSHRVGFDIDGYDVTRGLLIDPQLAYSTLFGGTDATQAHALAIDPAGNAYITGYTLSPDLGANGYQKTLASSSDAFVAKINTTASALVYVTYLGGGDSEQAFGIAVDSTGAAYVAGFTQSTNFPMVNAMQGAFGGGVNDAWVTKIDPTGGALAYSTYLGGNNAEFAFAITVDASGAAFVAGGTVSTDFPTVSPIQAANSSSTNRYDVFVAKINPAGSALTFSTYLGGTLDEDARGVAIDSAGNVFVAGGTTSSNFPTTSPYQAKLAGTQNAFVSKINAAGSAVIYSTYLGGTAFDSATAIAVDGAGSAYVTGSAGAGFPTTAGAFQKTAKGTGPAFVTKLNAAGTALAYSTYLGGSSFEQALAIAVDKGGSAVVTGMTNSADFPTVTPIQATYVSTDCFISRLDATGSTLTFSTFLGGSNQDYAQGVALDAKGNAYVGGYTYSNGMSFPTTAGAFKRSTVGGINAFAVEISNAPLSVAPPSATVAAAGKTSFAASGGTGSYAWAIKPNASGATIDTTGNYTAGATAGTDTIVVTDTAGTTATASVNVGLSAGADGGGSPTGSDGGGGQSAGATDGGGSGGSGGPGAAPTSDSGGCGCAVVGTEQRSHSSALDLGAAALCLALAARLRARRRREPGTPLSRSIT